MVPPPQNIYYKLSRNFFFKFIITPIKKKSWAQPSQLNVFIKAPVFSPRTFKSMVTTLLDLFFFGELEYVHRKNKIDKSKKKILEKMMKKKGGSGKQ